MALGSGSTGGLATIGIWLSCDMFNTEPRDFFRKSERMSNKDAWLRRTGRVPRGIGETHFKDPARDPNFIA